MTNKTLEETKAELAAISGKPCEQISSWDDLAKVIRLECVKAAEQVVKLEALHELAFGQCIQSGEAGNGSFQSASILTGEMDKSKFVIRSFNENQ